MPTNPHPRLAWALHLAGRGWPVFPLRPGAKQPAIQQWETRATTDQAQITAFWSAHPDHNIGLACGPAGLLVVDLDLARPGHTPPADEKRRGTTSGAQVLTRLARHAHTPVPDTWTVFTPSGGTHLYFRQPAGHQLRNTAGTLGWLVDTRGHGGYVVAPGSITTQGAYELVSDTQPATLPGWLVHRLTLRPPTAPTAPRRIATPHISAYAAAAIQGECARVRTAASGAHNRAQWVAGLALGQLVGAGHLDRDHALSRLQHAARGHIDGPCHCTERGVTAVFEWGLTRGARNPRRLTEGTVA